jgi:glyoxylase-like metal-dependent hydrolase (beta-lactamase superfamily II)
MKNDFMEDYKNGIYCVESGYAGGGVAAVYIIRDSGRAAIVDTAHNAALEPVKRALSELEVSESEVDYIFLTHVHLDHCGGAGLFAREFPAARVVVHERGARHVASPEKLVASAEGVYGAEEVRRLYGNVLPVASGRIIIPRDGDEFRVGGRVISCLDTPGHAKHHLAYRDSASGAVFSGDAYGMSYRELVCPEGRCAILTTSPVQFDPDAMRNSMRGIDALKPARIYPTHFGELPRDEKIISALYRQIDRYVDIAEAAAGDLEKIRAGLAASFKEEAALAGCASIAEHAGRTTALALELNANGLAMWYKKKQEG